MAKCKRFEPCRPVQANNIHNRAIYLLIKPSLRNWKVCLPTTWKDGSLKTQHLKLWMELLKVDPLSFSNCYTLGDDEPYTLFPTIHFSCYLNDFMFVSAKTTPNRNPIFRHMCVFKVCPIITHWGWVMHICISKLTIIGSDNDLSPGWHQSMFWSNAGILFILIEILIFSLKEIYFNMSPGNMTAILLRP